MWIGICEDEPEYRNRLENEVRSLAHPGDRVTVYANGSDLLDDIYAKPYPMDLLLLDMELPALSGIETALELQKASLCTQIVIVTKHRDFALRSFAIRPSNYLVKPVAIRQLKAEVDRARRIAGDDIGETLCIAAKDTVAFVPLKDILYMECFRYTLHIHTMTGTYQYVHTIGKMSDDLTTKGFCRIHKSILVNLRHVGNIDRSKRSAWMVTGQSLPVSELKITKVLAAYSAFWQSMAPMNTAPAITGAAHGDYSVSRSLAGTLG